MAREAVIVGAVRTAIGKRNGALSQVHAADLSAGAYDLVVAGGVEVNEAFASVPLAWNRDIGADFAQLNPLGGAIAVGHPLGASGAILMTRMINHMRRTGIRYGLQTMCEGGGTANATLMELV